MNAHEELPSKLDQESNIRIIRQMHIFKKYPRLILLGLTIIASYTFFMLGWLDWVKYLHNGSSALACVVAGVLFSFGFTAAFGFAIFVELAHTMHPLTGALLGGAGSLIADLTILTFVQEHLLEELKLLRQSWVFEIVTGARFHKHFPRPVRRVLLWVITAFVIASPLPDDIGIMLVSGLSHVDRRLFAFLCFALNTLGIFAILITARAV
jgi:hypothetical protein